jgi:hypothetical protein
MNGRFAVGRAAEVVRAFMRGLAAVLSIAVLPAVNAQAEIRIDGRLDEPEWSTARRFAHFFVTEPLTRGPPRYPTEVRLLPTPEGIAVGFLCTHPPETRRLREITPRDANIPGDRVNIYIDFDADAKVAYNMTVGLNGAQQDGTITNEVLYSTDWDGDWLSEVAETAGDWSVEMLIPWSIASMRGNDTSTRTVAVLFDRVLGATAERSATQPITFNSSRYVSDFEHVEIAQYRKPLFHFFPYASLLSDQVSDEMDGRFGADILWKPSGNLQLIAALNPDFGQVEADELVVNFDAIEAFFTDKRPFFTENQGMFDVRTPDEGLLIYTRRIGGPRDDEPERAAEIDGALKLTGSALGLDYGVLGAVERGYGEDLNSLFYAQRLVLPTTFANLGYLGTYVDRPFFDRSAQVHALDAVWRPSERWLVNAQLLGSFVDEQDASRNGDGAWTRAFYSRDANWEHELELTHFAARLDFTDMGFQRRASLNQAEYTLQRRFSDFAAGDSRGSVAWGFTPRLRWNDSGARLPHELVIERFAQNRSGAVLDTVLVAASRGVDDLISRGNGDVLQDARLTEALQSYQSPRIGRFRFYAAFDVFQEGNDDFALELDANAQFYALEILTFGVSLTPLWSRDWLIWQRDDLLASFHRRQIASGLDVDWFPRRDHELRVKFQWLALEAHAPVPYRIGPGGELIESVDVVAPFTVNNLGLQIRYRWTFAVQSDFYAVYSRGGLAFDDQPPLERSAGGMFKDALGLRDADQVLVKVRYRF